MGLVRLRKRLAVVVTLFGVLSQFIVLFGLSIGVDVVSRVLVGTGLTEDFPRPLVVPIAAMLVFALGTLTFLVEAIAAAPAVHAFAALTHYTNGLELGRREPVAGRHLWNPEMTPGLGLVALLGIARAGGCGADLPGVTRGEPAGAGRGAAAAGARQPVDPSAAPSRSRARPGGPRPRCPGGGRARGGS